MPRAISSFARTAKPNTAANAARIAAACAPPNAYGLRLNDTSIVAPAKSASPISRNFFAKPFTPSNDPRKPRTHAANSRHASESTKPSSAAAADARPAADATAGETSGERSMRAASPHACGSGAARNRSCQSLMNRR